MMLRSTEACLLRTNTVFKMLKLQEEQRTVVFLVEVLPAVLSIGLFLPLLKSNAPFLGLIRLYHYVSLIAKLK